MNQQELLQLISKYFARFSEQIDILNKNSEFSINIHAENVLVKILNTIFDCDFENVNYVEGKNYNSIDLRDKGGKLSVQVTATSSIKKIKDTLEGYTKNQHFKHYESLKILVLTGRQRSYSQKALSKITQAFYHFDDSSDILDFSTLYFLLNKQNDIAKILSVKELLELQFSDINTKIRLPIILTFKDLCTVLKPYFDENGHVFKMFGPNSGANGLGLLRWDLTLWEKSKRDKILPNNRDISALITEYKKFIPDENKELFESFLAHSYAFEKHCEDSNFDYTLYQFPNPIVHVINKFANG
ncbi:SMEK domain-containing protein [Mucilaginibacter sp.]|uniref:SMEK domain-containing protein n=1 Tax=Mucilaginibacter sp. TaxID=1882438 RepID=UPI003AFFAC92